LEASVTTLKTKKVSATVATASTDGVGKVYIRAMSKTAPTLDDYEKALHQMLDENQALRAELRTLVDWINGDQDALTTLQGLYLNPDEPASNRIRAAAAAIGYERPKLSASANLLFVDFRERVRQARLKAPLARTIEHIEPESA
jgi:hypothetical protein